MAKIDANTDYETASRTIAAQVERLHSALTRSVSVETLEQKLSRAGFTEAEKVCARVMSMAARTEEDDDQAREALTDTWEAHQGMLQEAEDAATTEAERTGDFRRAIRLQELVSMADSCVMVCGY